MPTAVSLLAKFQEDCKAPSPWLRWLSLSSCMLKAVPEPCMSSRGCCGAGWVLSACSLPESAKADVSGQHSVFSVLSASVIFSNGPSSHSSMTTASSTARLIVHS